MRTRLEYCLAILCGVLVLVVGALTLLLRDDWGSPSRDYPPYTNGLLLLTEKATAGSTAAASDAWEECASIAKIDRFDTRYNTIGVCSNFLYLKIENAIAQGDPAVLRSALGLLRDGGSPGFADRLQLYKTVARPFIKESCSKRNPPPGCKDAAALEWLDTPESPGTVTR